MNQKQWATVAADARRFFDFARELGKTVYRRINQAAKLGEFMDLSIELRDKLAQKAGIILDADLAFRDQCNTILNTCTVLDGSISRQKDIIGELLAAGAIDQRTEKRLMFRVLMLMESLQKGLALAHRIRERSSAIVLADYRVARHAGLASERARQAIEAGKSLHDTVTADWSGYCVNEREKEAETELLARIDALLESGDAAAMSRIREDVRAEIAAEEALSAGLAAQVPAAGAMARMASDLRAGAASIRGLMEEKSALVRRNLEESAQLSVVISLEITDYLKTRDLIDPGPPEAVGDEDRRRFEQLGVLADIAVTLIESLIELNRYAVEISDTNVKRDDQLIELSNMYYHCHGSISKECESAGELLSAATDGSRRNLIIGQVLEKNIRKILEGFGS